MRFTLQDKREMKIGEERVISKFLLFPRTIGKERRWLEMVNILQRVCTWTDADEMGIFTIYGWRDIKFL